jgi:hypothetical protein
MLHQWCFRGVKRFCVNDALVVLSNMLPLMVLDGFKQYCANDALLVSNIATAKISCTA